MYEVIKGAELPGATKPWSEGRAQLDTLDIGDIMLVDDATNINAIRCACTALKPKKFKSRKLLGREFDGRRGWAVQRTN